MAVLALGGSLKVAGAVADDPAADTITLTSSVAPSSMEMDVFQNGDVKLLSGGITIAALEVDSAAGNLIPANWTSMKSQKNLTQWSSPRGTPNVNQIAEFVSDPTTASGQPVTLANGTSVDYGNILPAGFVNNPANVTDLTFTYNQVLDTTAGTTASRVGTIVFVVPEPATLGLLGVAAVGLLVRKRRQPQAA